MNKDLLKIVTIVIVGIFIIYVIRNTFNLREGLEMPAVPPVPAGENGEAGSAANYASGIKAKTVQLQDTLLIPKYRSDYENIIINMDDYLSMLMLKTILNISPSADTKSISETLTLLNSLSSAKRSLDETMTFIDKQ